MSGSNCCFLTCIQISQEAGQLVWYSHLLKDFPQFTMIHTAKGFGLVSKAEVDVLLQLSCFFDDPMDVGDLISCLSAFSKSSLNIWKFLVHILLKTCLENFEHYFASVWDECNCDRFDIQIYWTACHRCVVAEFKGLDVYIVYFSSSRTYKLDDQVSTADNWRHDGKGAVMEAFAHLSH